MLAGAGLSLGNSSLQVVAGMPYLCGMPHFRPALRVSTVWSRGTRCRGGWCVVAGEAQGGCKRRGHGEEGL
jgi:hypothetical protein